MKEILLQAPDSQLDASMKPLVEKWSSPAKAIEILEVLDWCIHGSLASGLVVTLLQKLYDAALETEQVTHADMEKLATWRGKEKKGIPNVFPMEILEEIGRFIPSPQPSPPEELCALPEGSGLSWVAGDFLGIGLPALHLNGKKVGWLTPGVYGDNDEVLWTAFDNRTKENGCNPIVKIGDKARAPLLEASRALVELILQ